MATILIEPDSTVTRRLRAIARRLDTTQERVLEAAAVFCVEDANRAAFEQWLTTMALPQLAPKGDTK